MRTPVDIALITCMSARPLFIQTTSNSQRCNTCIKLDTSGASLWGAEPKGYDSTSRLAFLKFLAAIQNAIPKKPITISKLLLGCHGIKVMQFVAVCQAVMLTTPSLIWSRLFLFHHNTRCRRALIYTEDGSIWPESARAGAIHSSDHCRLGMI